MTYKVIHKGDQGQEWLDKRRTMGIGASESPTILGVGYGSPQGIYNRKVGLDTESIQNDAMWFGNILEDPIIQYYNEFIAESVAESAVPWQELLQSTETPCMICTPDAKFDDSHIMQIKTTASQQRKEDFKDGNVPMDVYVQVQHEMYVTGADVCTVVALLFHQNVVHTDVARDEKFIRETLIPKCEEFWALVKSGMGLPASMIDGKEDTKKALQAFYKDTDTDGIELDGSWVDTFEERQALKRVVKSTEERIDEIDNQFRHAIGTHDHAVLPGGGVVSWKPGTRKVYHVPQEVKNKYQDLITTRTIRFKEPKKGK